METSTIIVTLLSGLIAFIIYKLVKLSRFFKDGNVPYVPPVWPLGSDWDGSLFRQHFSQSWDDIYKKLEPHPMGGFFFYLKPIVMLRDPEYVNKVFVTDFSSFVDRGFYVDEKVNPLDGHLFFVTGDKWKYLRSKLSPAFTSGKLKWMFEQMKRCSDKFVDNYFDTAIPFNQDVDMKDTFARLTTDVISSCAFGIESNSLGEPDNKFRELGKMFFNVDYLVAIFFIARFVVPNWLSTFKIKTIRNEISTFFIDVVQQAFQHRLKTGYMRKDFVQILLDLRERGDVRSDEVWTRTVENVSSLKNEDEKSEPLIDPTRGDLIKIDDTVLTAQLLVFFLAGFETTSSVLYNTLYFLSVNPECQEKARQEAREVFQSSGGEFTFDSVARLTYIQKCASEALRLIPAAPMHFRVCTKDYTFPNGSTIKAGTLVVVPLYSIHMDPKYFPEPDKFIPERFDSPIQSGAYTPFGGGPRACIGKRFAETEFKLTLAMLLMKYYVKPASKQPTFPLRFHPMGLSISLMDPLMVRFEKIEK